MSKPISSYYEATKYLGQFVADKVPFLQETSCMDQESRRKIAILESVKPLFEKVIDKETLKLLDQVVLPLIEKTGFANWLRDTVTDMALRKGLKGDEDTEDFSNTEETPDSS